MVGVSKQQWYTVHVKSNQEHNTAVFYADRSIECFLPTYRTPSARKDRRGMLTKPLFTGYLFVRIDGSAKWRHAVLKAPGIVRMVGFGAGPTPVPDDAIESIRILTGDADRVRPHPLVKIGRKVKVARGPFSGAVGLLSTTDDRKAKLVVEIDFLGRAVAVPIETDEVVPLLD